VAAKLGINEDTSSSLDVDFQSLGSQLVVWGGTSYLYNFNFSDQQGAFIAETAAWVNMSAAYSETTTANISVLSAATLDLKGDGGGLNLRGNNTEVFVGSGGFLKLEPSGTKSLIQFGNFTTGEILENQGRVDVICQPGVNSQISIPVLNDGGQFNLNGGGNGQKQGSTFYITGIDNRTAFANFDMTSGELNLFNAVSLDASSAYAQSGGSLQTLDTYQEVLSLGAGIAIISGGKVLLDTDPNNPSEVGGHLVINCQKLVFSGGEYDPKIDGSNVANPNADLLEITGGTLNLSGATLNVTVLNPPPVVAVNWVIAKYPNNARTGTFKQGTLNGTKVNYGASQIWLSQA
jgi:hypothetical protein